MELLGKIRGIWIMCKFCNPKLKKLKALLKTVLRTAFDKLKRFMMIQDYMSEGRKKKETL